jgi:hypothetical protein
MAKLHLVIPVILAYTSVLQAKTIPPFQHDKLKWDRIIMFGFRSADQSTNAGLQTVISCFEQDHTPIGKMEVENVFSFQILSSERVRSSGWYK